MLRLTHKNSSNGYGKVKYKLGYWAGLRVKESLYFHPKITLSV